MFCKMKDPRDVTSSGIIKTNISDHFPYFRTLDIMEKKIHKPTFIKIINNSDSAMNACCGEIENSLMQTNLHNDLLADPNRN